MRRFAFLSLWFLTTFAVFAASAGTVGVLRAKKAIAIEPSPETSIGAATTPTPQDVRGISTQIESGDARAEVVSRFLARYKSPLQPYDHFGRFIVEAADRYGLDYRLIPAIMMQESNLCKNIIPDSHNCLGFGIHSRGTLKFDSYEASIERATRELRSNYIDKGLTTPEQIMRKYTPGSNGSWANSVNQWIAEMEYNDRQMGIKLDQDADLTEYTHR